MLEPTSCDLYLQYKTFVAQFSQVVMSFLRVTLGFPNLSQCTCFFRGTCIHGAITFSDCSPPILVLVATKYGWEFIFLVLQNLGNSSRRLYLKFSKFLHQITINQIFAENMSRGKMSLLISLSWEVFWKEKLKLPKVVSQILLVLILADKHCAFLFLKKIKRRVQNRDFIKVERDRKHLEDGRETSTK